MDAAPQTAEAPLQAPSPEGSACLRVGNVPVAPEEDSARSGFTLPV